MRSWYLVVGYWQLRPPTLTSDTSLLTAESERSERPDGFRLPFTRTANGSNAIQLTYGSLCRTYINFKIDI